MENSFYIKIWNFVKSTKFGIILLIIFIGYLLFAIFKKNYLKQSCKKKYDKCVIEKKEQTMIGTIYITYRYWVTGEMQTHQIKTYKDREVLQFVHVGDTLILEYCKENPNWTNNPIIKGEYLNQSFP